MICRRDSMLKQLIEKELGHSISDAQYSNIEMIFEIKYRARMEVKEKTYLNDLLTTAARISNRTNQKILG
jgi:hypothetical protein